MRATNHDHLILALSAIMSAAQEIVEDAFFMGKCRWCEETDLHDPRCPVTRLNRGLRAAHNVEIEFEEPAIEDRSKAVSTEVGKIINRLIEARPSRFSVTLPDKTLIEYVNLDTVPVTLETTGDESAATDLCYPNLRLPAPVIRQLAEYMQGYGSSRVNIHYYTAEMNPKDYPDLIAYFDEFGNRITTLPEYIKRGYVILIASAYSMPDDKSVVMYIVGEGA